MAPNNGFTTNPLPAKEAIFPGMLLKDRYLIERELGRGGLSTVYLASDQRQNSQRVAIKVLLKEISQEIWIKKKFHQELEALRRINHPGVVTALDNGELSDGRLYLVMEFVDGDKLRSVISKNGMDLEQAAHIVQQIGRALSAAHEHEIIHCDLNPNNIMLENSGDAEHLVKLIDFGIAKVKNSEVAAMAATQHAGTGPYMAPEQIEGNPLGQWTDVFAMGVVAYEMVTGQRPFDATSEHLLFHAHRAGVKALPRKLRPDLSEEAERLILKALALEPGSRHLFAHDFGELLAPALIESKYATRVMPQPALAARAAADDSSISAKSLRGLKLPLSSGLELAHVLFMDVVRYSELPIGQQALVFRQFQEIVCRTPTFQEAQDRGELITLPTGDGLALVFLRDLQAPAWCALEIARAVQDHPQIKLRMGIHSGPVFEVEDLNGHRNVVGGGINLAQRVMDYGDASHILISKRSADLLAELGEWTASLTDLGEHKVKHGVPLHFFNLCWGALGNRERPEKLRAEMSARPESPPSPRPQPGLWPQKKSLVIASAMIMLCGLLAYGLWRLNHVPSEQSAETSTPSASNPASALPDIEIMRYSLALESVGRETARVTGIEPLPTNPELKFHFIPRESGYLYIVAPGEKNVPTTFLTAQPHPDSGVRTNQLAAGIDYSFPSREAVPIGLEPGTSDIVFTIIFSSVPLETPAFLTTSAGRELTTTEQSEFETWRKQWGASVAKSTVEPSGQQMLVKLPAGQASGRPLIFDLVVKSR